MSIFIGLDLSISETGWCIFNKEGYTESGIVVSKKQDHPCDMLRFIDTAEKIIEHTGLENLLEDNPIILIENYAMRGKGQITRIAEFTAVVKTRLYSILPWENIWYSSPQTLKKFIMGKGNADKSLILKEIYRKYNMDFNNDNEADAYGLTRILWSMHNEDFNPLKYEVDVFKAIRKSNKEAIDYAAETSYTKAKTEKRKTETRKKKTKKKGKIKKILKRSTA